MSEEEVREDLVRLHPFDVRGVYEYVRETTHLYDKRISAMTDLFHALQLSFKEQDTFLRTKLTDIEGRYVNGTSRTLQEVKAQNAELEKSLVRVEGLLTKTAADIDKRISLLAQDASAEFKGIGNKFQEYEQIKKDFRDFVWRLLFWMTTGLLGAAVSLFLYINSIKSQIQQIPAVLAYQEAVSAANRVDSGRPRKR